MSQEDLDSNLDSIAMWHLMSLVNYFLISSQYNYWNGKEEVVGLPSALWFLDAEIIIKTMYPESFLDTKVTKLYEHKIRQDFPRIALGSLPDQAGRTIIPSTRISLHQRLLVSRGMDALCGSKSAKQKRTDEPRQPLPVIVTQHPAQGGGRQGGCWVSQSLVFLQQLHEDYKYLSWLYSFIHSNESSCDERPEICWDEININWNRKWILAPTTMNFRRRAQGAPSHRLLFLVAKMPMPPVLLFLFLFS